MVAGLALDKFGPRKVAFTMAIFTGLSLVLSSQAHALWQLYITYSLLMALGTGGLFVIVNSTTSRWFIKKRGFAVGITTSAGATGQVIMAPITSLLITAFDWRVASIILGVVTWIILLPISRLMIRDPADIGLYPDGIKLDSSTSQSQYKEKAILEEGLTLSQAYKFREFWLLGFMWLLQSISVNMILTHTVVHAIDLHISPINAALIVSVIGIGAISARLGVGKLSDSIGRKVPAVICAILQAGSLLWLIWIKELWMFYIFAVIFGYGWGGLGSQITVLVGDIFGIKNIGSVMGTITSGWLFGGAIGPALGGIVYDATGNYTAAFAIAVAGMVLTTIFALLLRPGKAVLRMKGSSQDNLITG